MDSDELAQGRLIAQRYRLDRLLGEGGMGAVWAATHVVTKKQVALKFLKPAAAVSPAHVKRFLREARAASAVRHPNVVEIHDIIAHENGMPAMVMDLLLGESLAERLARVSPMALAELAPLLLPVISAVGTAHSLGIVHRDIKPDNLFLEQGLDGKVVPRVLDFGIAKLSAQEGAAAETANLTRTGSIMGTPYYMAPEQVFGERDVDQRADVWAFGVILYEALSGRRPIDGDNFGQLFKLIATGQITPLEQMAPHLPSDVTALVMRMLSKDRSQRPRDLREVFEVLRRYADVGAASFASARPDLDVPRDESAGAYAPTQTPMQTPAQFGEGAGGTALLVSEPSPGPERAAFSRTDSERRASRSAFKWLGAGGIATVVTLGGVTLLKTPEPGAAASASPEPPTNPIPSVPPAGVSLPSASAAASASLRDAAVELTPSVTSVARAAVPAPSAAPKKRGSESSARLAHSAPKPDPIKPLADAPAASPQTPAKLPGGIAPNAPF